MIWNNSEIKNKWISIKKVKQVVNTAIEDIRNKKIIGSSLETNVIVYLKDEYLNFIKEEDLSEIFICSEAKAEIEELKKKTQILEAKPAKKITKKRSATSSF